MRLTVVVVDTIHIIEHNVTCGARWKEKWKKPFVCSPGHLERIPTTSIFTKFVFIISPISFIRLFRFCFFSICSTVDTKLNGINLVCKQTATTTLQNRNRSIQTTHSSWERGDSGRESIDVRKSMTLITTEYQTATTNRKNPLRFKFCVCESVCVLPISLLTRKLYRHKQRNQSFQIRI